MSAESEFLIVGSGPAGAMAAWALRGRDVRMVDAGFTVAPGLSRLDRNIFDLRCDRDLTAHAIGSAFEGLQNLRGGRAVSLKLRAPGLEFVIRHSDQLAPLVSETFQPVISLAKGGFGNAWGAGVYRFGEDDLRGFPLATSDLAPHYDEVSRHIGISGAVDDLAAEFGEEPSLQAPLRMSRNCASILAAYETRRAQLNTRGVRLGRARLAVLSEPHRGREPYAYRSLEFLQPGDPAAYNPAMTIDELRQAGSLRYESGWLAKRFRENETGVELDASPIGGGAPTAFRARKLILAAGALNSARIVLASANDHSSRLPLLDNPMTVLPLFHLNAFGQTIEPGASGLAQLNAVFDAAAFGAKFQASLYGATGAPMTEFLAQLPFSLDTNRRLLRYLLPAISLAMVFYPSDPSPGQWLRLREDGALEAGYGWRPDPSLASRLCAVFRTLGCWSLPGIAKHAGPGQGIHYAGTLPMRGRPARHELHPDGRLEDSRSAYVVDGACFPRLPSKNLTYSIMANAHRIASGLAR